MDWENRRLYRHRHMTYEPARSPASSEAVVGLAAEKEEVNWEGEMAGW